MPVCRGAVTVHPAGWLWLGAILAYGRGAMLDTRNPVEVLTILRAAARLLVEEAEQLRRHAVSLADRGHWGPTRRYRALREAAVDLGKLAVNIAGGVERPQRELVSRGQR